jgi:K+-sensing histidine kinase KdpD
MSSREQFSTVDVESRQGRSRSIVRVLLWLVLVCAGSHLLAFMLADPAFKPLAIVGLVILLVVLVTYFGFFVAILVALINVLLFAYVFHDPKGVFYQIVQFLRGLAGSWL